MGLRDGNRKFVMVDDVRVDPILDYFATNNIPLLGHNFEPRVCWLPLDKMTLSQGHYGTHPEYHVYLHPENPWHQDQIDASDRMFEKRPGLILWVHMVVQDGGLDELAK